MFFESKYEAVLSEVFGPDFDSFNAQQKEALFRDVMDSVPHKTLEAFQGSAKSILQLIGGRKNVKSYVNTILLNYPDLRA